MYPNAAVSAEWVPETFIGKNRYNGRRIECLRIGGCPVVANTFFSAGHVSHNPLPPKLLHSARWFIYDYIFATYEMIPDPDMPTDLVLASYPPPSVIPNQKA